MLELVALTKPEKQHIIDPKQRHFFGNDAQHQ
jgi:hypothetical protein